MKNKPSPVGCCPPEFIGTTVVGERGQVVIPKDVRDSLNLQPGTKLIVMRHGDGLIALLPVEHMRHVMEAMTQNFTQIQDVLNS